MKRGYKMNTFCDCFVTHFQKEDINQSYVYLICQTIVRVYELISVGRFQKMLANLRHFSEQKYGSRLSPLTDASHKLTPEYYWLLAHEPRLVASAHLER